MNEILHTNRDYFDIWYDSFIVNEFCVNETVAKTQTLCQTDYELWIAEGISTKSFMNKLSKIITKNFENSATNKWTFSRQVLTKQISSKRKTIEVTLNQQVNEAREKIYNVKRYLPGFIEA